MELSGDPCFTWLLQVSVESLKASNGILAGDYIAAGDTITVPYQKDFEEFDNQFVQTCCDVEGSPHSHSCVEIVPAQTYKVVSRTRSEECVQLCHLDVGGKYLPRRQIVCGGLSVIES